VQHLNYVLLAHVFCARSDVSVLHIIHLITHAPLCVCNFSSVPSVTTTQSQSTILSIMKHVTDPSTASYNAVLSCLQAHGTCIKISFIGTQPERQGQGLGGQLLRAVSRQGVRRKQIWICCRWLSLLFCMLWHLFKIASYISACCALLYLHPCLRMYAIPYFALLL